MALVACPPPPRRAGQWPDYRAAGAASGLRYGPRLPEQTAGRGTETAGAATGRRVTTNGQAGPERPESILGWVCLLEFCQSGPRHRSDTRCPRYGSWAAPRSTRRRLMRQMQCSIVRSYVVHVPPPLPSFVSIPTVKNSNVTNCSRMACDDQVSHAPLLLPPSAPNVCIF